jgi:DNA ligase-associated metallophosphoesterase
MLGGVEVWLMPERALYVESQKTLYVADVHIGKTATLRAFSVPIPGGTTASDVCRLGRLLERTGAERLAILGDLLHARQGRAPATIATVSQWREANRHVEMILVRGNHDVGAGDPPAGWDIQCVASPHLSRPFVLCHKPCTNEEGYTLAGHVHPAIRLRGKARQSERLPCFHVGPQLMVLPAFGSFTGTAYIQRETGDRIFAIAGDEVIEV